MKKSTLLAAMATVALGASAQYAVTPGVADFKTRVPAADCEITALVLGEALQNDLKAAGYNVNTSGLINDETTHWWWWAGWGAGDDSYPDPDFSGDGYISQSVTGDAGWSGGGLAVDNGAGFSTNFNDESVLHITVRSSNQPASLGFIMFDSSELAAAPAKFSIGKSAFDDNGTIYPLIGDIPADGDWACYEISFANLKKIWPAFNYVNAANWYGNSLSIISGNIAGSNFGICETFIYTRGGAGVSDVATDNAPATYYNLQGVEVQNPTNGLYIKCQGNTSTKVLVK